MSGLATMAHAVSTDATVRARLSTRSGIPKGLETYVNTLGNSNKGYADDVHKGVLNTLYHI